MTRPSLPADSAPRDFEIARADGDLLFDAEGGAYLDLLSGGGTVLLGHCRPAIVDALRTQADTLWNTGAVPVDVRAEASAALERFLPGALRPAVFYSTGMEAAEFALRLARQVTGRRAAVGFDHAMHGKSQATAALGWPNELATLTDFHRLPYLPETTEGDVLERLRATLAAHEVAAVFFEPLLGSFGGHCPSRAFGQSLGELCAEGGALLVVDEILTGFHRCGPAFLHADLGVAPDVLLVGKAMGNGFPVAAVAADRRYPLPPAALPGSTFAGNPLAAAVVATTLTEMEALDLPALVARVEAAVRAGLAGVGEDGAVLRGRGALWILELPDAERVARIMEHLLRERVVASPTARFLRLMPPATIGDEHLARACRVIAQACRATAPVR
ncbi:MAG: aminotransferase class III-fold pyridoxal phosphate-dependent enzyme [Planctomycetota bacterium]|jgi:acetylornithine/succinyldiaminopimelate/putrescine aminotransferase|nr:aminotransferase class III-fold pyridoxal phosphate-dependent enzyme [Planctomycetota bacterium]MDP6764270.1 aminotransferase class III-fold pyridoxal phosphate-dependent enzyme [Planctomycetota bacterium]MDP6990785.1 aminotransferase class III-fold pyridoxal phosphate-dependent enzyme [Planctomycetota bacterium]